jgi:hypothetical protein
MALRPSRHKHGNPPPTLAHSSDPRTCRFTHSRAVRSFVLRIPIPVLWAMREHQGPSHPRNPFGRPASGLRPAYPSSFSPPTPGAVPSPSSTSNPLPIPIAAPQLVPTSHHKAPTQEKIAAPHLPRPLPATRCLYASTKPTSPIRCPSRMQRRSSRKHRGLRPPSPPPHLPPLPSRRLYASTKPIPDPLPITHPDSGTPKKQSWPACSAPAHRPPLPTRYSPPTPGPAPSPSPSPIRYPSRLRRRC